MVAMVAMAPLQKTRVHGWHLFLRIFREDADRLRFTGLSIETSSMLN
jgi:hypothetical protein